MADINFFSNPACMQHAGQIAFEEEQDGTNGHSTPSALKKVYQPTMHIEQAHFSVFSCW